MVNAPMDAKTAAPVAAPAIIKDLKGLKLSDGALVSSAGQTLTPPAEVVEAPKEEAKLDIDTLLHSTDAAKRQKVRRCGSASDGD